MGLEAVDHHCHCQCTTDKCWLAWLTELTPAAHANARRMCQTIILVIQGFQSGAFLSHPACTAMRQRTQGHCNRAAVQAHKTTDGEGPEHTSLGVYTACLLLHGLDLCTHTELTEPARCNLQAFYHCSYLIHALSPYRHLRRTLGFPAEIVRDLVDVHQHVALAARTEPHDLSCYLF